MRKKQQFKPVDSKQSFPKIEHEMLDFWDKEHIFEKSLEKRKKNKKYVFFDGPPFANGLPHYGHILANALKDAVTRYFTMRGYYVPRVNGWDCHGLPVEYEIEKELKLSGRKDIEKMGIAKFNAECRKSVFRYTEEWEKLLKRIGRWVDFEHSYATLDNTYMESIWWIFSEIWKKKMVYQDYKSMHICPRCETPLSNFEVTLGYKDVRDVSVYIKFKVIEGQYKNAYILAWTTTPWTLPGNALLALGPSIKYVLVRKENENYILAKDLMEKVFGDDVKNVEIIKEIGAKELEKTHYEPLFPYYKGHKNAFRVVLADFVSLEDGTGVVHIAPGFGEDDMAIGKEEKVEPIMHVKMDGTFSPEVTLWAGKFVKGQDLAVKDHLQKEGKLFRFENYRHSYPHCWRCDTPLLNFSTKAWFIRVTDVKSKLLANNKKIHWVPEHIKEGRFGKWLEGARDWNVSRNRFWGCPIPVWQCKCGNQKCIGSVKELRENSAQGNTFIFVRHGEAEQNVKGIVNSDPKQIYHLTEKGKSQANDAAAKLKVEKIDMIFASPFVRVKETAEIIAKKFGVEVEFDQHLVEHNTGAFEGKPEKDFLSQYKDLDERYSKKIGNAESFKEVEERTSKFIDLINHKYSGKTFVVVTHGNVIRAALHCLGEQQLDALFKSISPFGGLTKIYAGKLPKRNDALDLHKPYIDEIKLKCEKCGEEMTRILDVLDCWFESGSMPYAQLHYPFENKKEFEDNFPANFIAEGLDQTRGWFYTLHVLSTILFDKPAFKNVIVNGILLAADGEKLSKRKKNYPDPSALFETHGVDSTRFFLYTSTAPLAEDVRFSERHVEEIIKQFTLTLWNTYSFFVTYANIDGWTPQLSSPTPIGDLSDLSQKSKIDSRPLTRIFDFRGNDTVNKLDEWIISELNELIDEVTVAMEEYNLTKATRPFLTFVDNLSNWYVRRSRRRFWKSESDTDKEQAYQALYTVLTTLSKLLAPFMPATADSIYKNLADEESVHLADWPTSDKKLIKKNLNREIRTVRTIVSLALRIRSKNNIKVRQPLALLRVILPKNIPQGVVDSYRDVILEELNIKEIKFEKEGKIAAVQISADAHKIGPRFGKETQQIIVLCKNGDYKMQSDGSINLPAKGTPKYVLNPDEVTIGYKGNEGFDVESAEGILVSLDTAITKELKEEGYVRDIVRYIQELRKEANYGISDRIYVFVKGPPIIQEAVTRFADMIEKETLAIELQEGARHSLGEGGEWDKEQEVEVDGNKVKVGVRK